MVSLTTHHAHPHPTSHPSQLIQQEEELQVKQGKISSELGAAIIEYPNETKAKGISEAQEE